MAEALNAVAGAKISLHEKLADGVVRVSYDNGVAIVVNYTENAYNKGGISVEPMDYTVVEGGR